MPQLLPSLVKEPTVPIDQEAGWAKELVWSLCRREKSLAFARN